MAYGTVTCLLRKPPTKSSISHVAPGILWVWDIYRVVIMIFENTVMSKGFISLQISSGRLYFADIVSASPSQGLLECWAFLGFTNGHFEHPCLRTLQKESHPSHVGRKYVQERTCRDLAFQCWSFALQRNWIKVLMHFPLKTSVEPQATPGSSRNCPIKES